MDHLVAFGNSALALNIDGEIGGAIIFVHDHPITNMVSIGWRPTYGVGLVRTELTGIARQEFLEWFNSHGPKLSNTDGSDMAPDKTENF